MICGEWSSPVKARKQWDKRPNDPTFADLAAYTAKEFGVGAVAGLIQMGASSTGQHFKGV